MKSITRLTLVAAAGVLMLGASDSQEWEQQLEAQLLEDERCELSYTTNTRSLELGGDRSVSGRAHCSDGRSFDFSRLRPGEKFTLAACEVVSC